MTYYNITVFYLDGTKEEHVGEARMNAMAGELKIYNQNEGTTCIPLSSIKKYTNKE